MAKELAADGAKQPKKKRKVEASCGGRSKLLEAAEADAEVARARAVAQALQDQKAAAEKKRAAAKAAAPVVAETMPAQKRPAEEIDTADQDPRAKSKKQRKRELELTPEGEREAEREAELNKACTAAKQAHKASPDDPTLKEAYDKAKADFATLQKAKLLAAHKGSGDDGPNSTWTCTICNVTFKLGEAGRNRELHLAGKMHCRLVAAAALPDGEAAAQKEKLKFTCNLCGCSMAATAGPAHLAGAKHAERARLLAEVLEKAPPKKGDWVCCARRPAHRDDSPCLNFASKDVCARSTCGAVRSSGLTVDEAKAIVQEASSRAPQTASASAARGRGAGGEAGRGSGRLASTLSPSGRGKGKGKGGGKGRGEGKGKSKGQGKGKGKGGPTPSPVA